MKPEQTTQELLDEMKTLPKFDLYTNPEFISEVINGLIVNDFQKIMDENEISQSSLAKKIGKSRQYISRVMHEKRNFTMQTLALFSCALECEISIKITPRKKLSDANLQDIKANF